MIMKYKQAVLYICFLFSHHYVCYVTDLIKKRLLVYVYWLLLFLIIRIKFGHAQLSVPKIGILMSKTVCINPFMYIPTYVFVENYLNVINVG